MSKTDLSAREARCIALSAQGFASAPLKAKVGVVDLRRLATRLGAIQIDSVNVLVRSHYLPAYSRLGPYSMQLFDKFAYERKGMFEYWGHAASFLPIELHPLMRWRMAKKIEEFERFRAIIEGRRPGYVKSIELEIAQRGPLAFGDLADPGRLEKVKTKYSESSMAWWHWADGKSVLESLFDMGRIAVAGRRNFERLYDFAERVIPEEIRALPTPSEEDARRALIKIAAGALGVATVKDLADYFRLPMAETRARARELVEHGDLLLGRVEGWTDPAYLAAGAKDPAMEAHALVSPFDSLVWNRARAERLFGFHYRIEIYVPEPKRVHGYYVLPFLLGDTLVARVDLKADRKNATLLVPGAFLEHGNNGRHVAGELATELQRMADWLALDHIEVGDRGDLTPQLVRALRTPKVKAAR